jgi:hypothetical protein
MGALQGREEMALGAVLQDFLFPTVIPQGVPCVAFSSYRSWG